MKIEMSDIVISLNGRDEGKRFFVIGTEDEYALLADGKGRRLEKPKRKNNKHLRLVARIGSRTAERLRNGEKVTNNELKKALAEFEAGAKHAAGHERAGEHVSEPGRSAVQRTNAPQRVSAQEHVHATHCAEEEGGM